tara:strand:- start:413 stop:1465 length:1053 start_codon:yes stop_codon:yes gene_type:complete
MSEAQYDSEQEQKTSAEEKFFGVRTQIGKKSNEDLDSENQLELEIVDDREEEDRRPPKAQSAADDDLDDEELSGYSEKVQKRINKLRYEQHEERRKREAAEKMREEAIRVAEQLNQKNRENEALINRGEAALVSQIKQRAELALQEARNRYKKAYEEGDTDNVVASQESLMRAQAELSEAERYENNLAQSQVQREQQEQQFYQQRVANEAAQNVAQQQQQVQVDPEAQEWANKNPWFMQDGYEEMTSLAYGTHASLIKKGIQPNSSEYFRQIDRRLRNAFPEYDWQDNGDTDGRDATVTVNQPSTVVAPSARSNGAKPRKIRLTSTQLSLAKRLGLTPEQYARQLAKESS